MNIESGNSFFKAAAFMEGESFKLKDLEKRKRGSSLFLKASEYVARNILGDYLVLKNGRLCLIGKIVETESYLGINDDASHSFGGRVTERNKIMYRAGGLIYIYLIYGKFFCFNIVVSKKNDPQAVFIRALEPLKGIEAMKKNRKVDNARNLTNGPCRWTIAFGINKDFLGKSITSSQIYISASPEKSFEIVKTKRIGIDYAVRCRNLPLRFYIKDNPFVSKK